MRLILFLFDLILVSITILPNFLLINIIKIRRKNNISVEYSKYDYHKKLLIGMIKQFNKIRKLRKLTVGLDVLSSEWQLQSIWIWNGNLYERFHKEVCSRAFRHGWGQLETIGVFRLFRCSFVIYFIVVVFITLLPNTFGWPRQIINHAVIHYIHSLQIKFQRSTKSLLIWKSSVDIIIPFVAFEMSSFQDVIQLIFWNNNFSFSKMIISRVKFRKIIKNFSPESLMDVYFNNLILWLWNSWIMSFSNFIGKGG